jgi:LPS-assembly protein
VEDTGARNEDNTPTRFIPEVEAKWSYPLMNQFEHGHMTVEPIVTIAASPYGGNPDSIPNEDSQNFELNELNLFSANKFTGYDRLEEGPRASYGLRTSFTTDSNKTLGVLLGQSYHLKAENQLYNNSGLEDHVSNYVGRVDVSDSKWVDASYSFRMNQDNARFERSEFSSTLNLHPLSITTDYIFLNRGNFRALEDDREEISGYAAYKIASEWTLLGNIRRGLGQTEQNGGLISSGLGVLFQNECIGFTTIFNREYTRDRDIEPSTSVVFQVTLANLN